ncbi:MAG TPA: hypothetical protein VGK73_18525 [Polyangiaceae bacterium]
MRLHEPASGPEKPAGRSPNKALGAWLSSLRRRPPFTWPKKRKRRLFIGFLVLLLAYPVLGTLALWTGFVEWMLKSEDLRVELRNPSYTLWPGHVRMRHVRVLANGSTQFILESENIELNINLFQLVKRRVHVTQISAENTLYQMRVQVKDKTGIEERVAAYPPLAGLPGRGNVVSEAPAKQGTADGEKKESDFTVQVEGIDIGVRELWFFEYRYLGKGRLRGAFTVGPNVMEVKTAVQDLGPGEVRFGAERVVSRNLRGQISADIPRLNPNERADASFMELVTARVNLRTDVQSLENLGAYAPGVEVSGGAGPLALDLYLDRGKLGPKSHLDYQTESLGVKGNGYGVASDLLLKFDARGSKEQLPLVQTSAKATYVSLSRRMRSFTLQIHGHREEARLDTIQLSRATDLKGATVHMPTLRSVDMQDLPVVLPEDSPVEVRSGDLRGSLHLEMDEKYWVRGPLKTEIKDLVLKAAGVEVGANVKLESALRFNPKQKINHVDDFVFTLRDAGMRAGDRSVENWWMNVVSRRLSFWNTEPPRFEGTLSVRARDLQPVLEALAERDVILDLIPKFTHLTDFRASAMIEQSGPKLDITLASESDVWDAAGRVYKNGDQTQFAVTFGGQAVSLGIAKKGDDLDIQPFAKTTWLNERLREFPQPERMRGKKP